jgi:riboflavin kinase/FMN adenylyltransferase
MDCQASFIDIENTECSAPFGAAVIAGKDDRRLADPEWYELAAIVVRPERLQHRRMRVRDAGNVELLKKLGAELNFAVHGLAAVSLDGKAVSSTRIREAIASGDLDRASQMLGRAYSLAGTVIRGDGLGRQLGFPTANLDVTGLALPPHGVYSIQAEIRLSSAVRPSSSRHRGVLNVGVRPTLANPAPQLRVEAHLLDFHGDLYGQEMEIVIGEKLRDEKKFGSLADLKQQIARDIEHARAHV